MFECTGLVSFVTGVPLGRGFSLQNNSQPLHVTAVVVQSDEDGAGLLFYFRVTHLIGQMRDFIVIEQTLKIA